jgi:hypothetical protein
MKRRGRRLAWLAALLAAGCAIQGPEIRRTAATARKTVDQVKADLYDCAPERTSPLASILPSVILFALKVFQDQAERECIEARGYVILEPPEAAAGPAPGPPDGAGGGS